MKLVVESLKEIEYEATDDGTLDDHWKRVRRCGEGWNLGRGKSLYWVFVTLITTLKSRHQRFISPRPH
jgi:hypothetical protein